MADIYSLGVVIVELVTGTKSIPHITNVLRRWTHRWNKSATRHQQHQVIKCMEIALRCSLQEPENRPSINEIIRDLSETGSTSGSISQTSLCQHDDMLGIEPLELRFHFEHNKQISCSVELTNETSNSTAFNILTPSEQYIAQPDKGIVLPGGKREVKITLQSQESATQVTNGDKFVVQSIKLKEGLADEEITDRMFNSKGSEVVDEVNLMVVYDPEKYREEEASKVSFVS
uniref:MSP domain-containing protein n=2 Tax=Aegilops tauschii subsp. strangulata TaxID=200361 RepID=A0A453MLY8_AEGTS